MHFIQMPLYSSREEGHRIYKLAMKSRMRDVNLVTYFEKQRLSRQTGCGANFIVGN